MNILLTVSVLSILACGGILWFQLALLSEIGLIYKRLGKDLNEVVSRQTKLEGLVGRKTTLVAGTRAIFASLSCSSCYAVLRSVSLKKEAKDLSVFLVDQFTNDDAAIANSFFPDLRLKFLPGREFVKELNITDIPFYAEVGKSNAIEKVLYLEDSPLVLNNIFKEENA